MDLRRKWPCIFLLFCIICRARTSVPLGIRPTEDFKRRTSLSNTHWWTVVRNTILRPTNERSHLAYDESGLFSSWPNWRWSFSSSSPPGVTGSFPSFWSDSHAAADQMQSRMHLRSNKLHSSEFEPPWMRQSKGVDLEGNMFSRYLTLKEIYDYLDTFATTYDDLVTVEEIGRTFEGRPINLVRISSGSAESSINFPKPAVWIDAGIHPREWISISTALYLINKLVIGAGQSAIKDLVARYEWYILPVVNPDGYEYTWTTDRMWRKNRVWHPHSQCRGVDLNRNFDFFFIGPSSNSNPCHEKYPGHSPFSEAETLAIRNRTAFLRPKLVAFISMHSYDQLWMVPYGPTLRRPKHYTKMMNMAKVAADAIKRTSGRNYHVGTISQLSGMVGGGSIDWAYEALRVKYSFAVELRDTGRSGFLLPSNQIVPTGREMWAAVLAVAGTLAKELQMSNLF